MNKRFLPLLVLLLIASAHALCREKQLDTPDLIVDKRYYIDVVICSPMNSICEAPYFGAALTKPKSRGDYFEAHHFNNGKTRIQQFRSGEKYAEYLLASEGYLSHFKLMEFECQWYISSHLFYESCEHQDAKSITQLGEFNYDKDGNLAKVSRYSEKMVLLHYLVFNQEKSEVYLFDADHVLKKQKSLLFSPR